MSQSSFQPAADDQPTASQPMTAQAAVMESPEYTVGGPFSQGADRLMDDLFVDLEQALAKETLLSVEPEPEAAPSLPIEPPSFSIAPPAGTGMMTRLTPRQLVPGEVEPDADVILAVNEPVQPERKSRSLDMLLLSTLCASLLTTGILWLWFRHRAAQVPAPAPVATAPQPTAEQIKANQQQEFLNYVDRSLDRIEQAAKEQRLAQQNQSEPEKPASTPSQTVLERVYVPVYQPPQVIAAQPNVVIQQPNLPSTVPAPAPTVPASAANVPNIATNSSYKLVGVLELGDRSAALFDINGSPRRIQVGEPIGDSGWTLVSVSNQEAIVRRNGEVRSVYVGQAF